MCAEKSLFPAELVNPGHMTELQKRLAKSGQYIPGYHLQDPDDLVKTARITGSSEFDLKELPFDGPWKKLDFSMAQMLPVDSGQLPGIKILIKSEVKSKLAVELRLSQKPDNYTPEVVLERLKLDIEPGVQFYSFAFGREIPEKQYAFVTLLANSELEVKCTEKRVTGLLTVFQKFNKSVATSSRQAPPAGIGIDSFEFWVPERRPEGHNLAFELSKNLWPFQVKQITNGIFRPTTQPNAWVASPNDPLAFLTLTWAKPKAIAQVNLYFDTDFDHPMESSLMGHPESEIPFCVKSFLIKDDSGNVIHREENNYQSIQRINFKEPIKTTILRVELEKKLEYVPVSLFGITCYSKP